jgi:hypothetical protein
MRRKRGQIVEMRPRSLPAIADELGRLFELFPPADQAGGLRSHASARCAGRLKALRIALGSAGLQRLRGSRAVAAYLRICRVAADRGVFRSAGWSRLRTPFNGRAPSTTATAPGVVLCVADGIVRIVVHVVASEDLGGRL